MAKLRSAIEAKKTHKAIITRDLLLVDLALGTGMRRGELSDLKAGDIHADFLIVHGKGGKRRTIPLLPKLASRLHDFTKQMNPQESVFKLKPASISNKIRFYTRLAGLHNFHTHTMRHKFATGLLERGADIRSLQELLGHADLSSTQLYLSVTDERLRETVNLLDDAPRKKKPPDDEPEEWVQPVTY